MRVVVIYDSGGNVKSLITAPEGGANPGTQLQPGEAAGTIDVPDLSEDLDPEETNKRLVEIQEQNIVEVQESEVRLRSKEQ